MGLRLMNIDEQREEALKGLMDYCRNAWEQVWQEVADKILEDNPINDD